MFITIEENLECSKCGSRNRESFQQALVRGIRCLHCGHEKVTPDPVAQKDSVTRWTKQPDRVEKF